MATSKLQLLLPAEAAQLLGVSAALVRHLVDCGRLAGVRTPSGRRLIFLQSVEALRRERGVPSAQGPAPNGTAAPGRR